MHGILAGMAYTIIITLLKDKTLILCYMKIILDWMKEDFSGIGIQFQIIIERIYWHEKLSLVYKHHHSEGQRKPQHFTLAKNAWEGSKHGLQYNHNSSQRQNTFLMSHGYHLRLDERRLKVENLKPMIWHPVANTV